MLSKNAFEEPFGCENVGSEILFKKKTSKVKRKLLCIIIQGGKITCQGRTERVGTGHVSRRNR